MDNFKAIYRLLRTLEAAMDAEGVNPDKISAEALGISRERWVALLEMLAKAGYIEGVAVTRANDGYTAVSLSSPRITLRGLEYLEENSLMRKAAAIAKGIAEVL